MHVRWSLPAAEDLERICERIERDNPEAARRVARTIYDGCAKLKDFPHLGRASSRMTGRRELVFATLPYIVVYRVTEQAVEISRIFQEVGSCLLEHFAVREPDPFRTRRAFIPFIIRATRAAGYREELGHGQFCAPWRAARFGSS